MKLVIFSKIPFLKLFREFFKLEFGILDYDDVLELLCSGITAAGSDREHIRNMVYGNVWFDEPSEPYTNEQKQRLFSFFLDVRGKIVWQVHQNGRVPYHLHIRFSKEHTTRMALAFEVRQ